MFFEYSQNSFEFSDFSFGLNLKKKFFNKDYIIMLKLPHRSHSAVFFSRRLSLIMIDFRLFAISVARATASFSVSDDHADRYK